jgi:hypothetical protein
MERSMVYYGGEYFSRIPGWSQLRVQWRDAVAPHSGWHEVDEYTPEDAVATTVGHLWPDCHDQYLTLAGTVFDFEGDQPKTVGDINHIPYGMILKVEVIHARET